MAETAAAVEGQTRILLVEDEGLIAMDLRQRLENLGYATVATARTADDALRLAASHAPDLVLMDIHLDGEKDGIQAAEAIRETLNAPIVYLTAHSDNLTIERAKVTGPFGYITKPFETDNLRVQIEIALFRHQMEQKLRRSEARLSTTLRNIGDAVVATDNAGRIELMNPVAEELTGWTMEAAAGELASKVFQALDVKTSEPIALPLPAVLGPEGVRKLRGEYRLRSRSGSLVLVHMVISANESQDGGLPGSVIVFRDITAQRELEERERASQSMDSIAVMAGGLAHDFNNLLTVILGNADIARAAHQKAVDALDQIAGAGQSAAILSRRLLTVSRKDMVKPEIFDLNELIEGNAKTLQKFLGPTNVLHLRTSSENLPVTSDRTEIQQALANLAANARDAMPQGGTFTITTRHNGGFAEIELKDSGIGMTDETRRRIFQPFFSRKGDKGTGLGMTIVHSIVTKWSGTIEVKSDPGRGTEFRISFPLSGTASEPQARSAEFQSKQAEDPVKGAILLVEDAAAVREFLREELEASGFRVFEASNGGDALRFPELHKETVSLLITDVVMPGITGPELAKQWVARWPETRVLFMSGYSDEDLKENELLRSGAAEFVAKPIKAEHLISIARRMLARKTKVQG